MDLQEVACGGMDWIGLAQDREWNVGVWTGLGWLRIESGMWGYGLEWAGSG
jgi:hypothetical protein